MVFSDFVEFVNNEVRAMTNPVFGKITDDTKPPPGPRSSAASNCSPKPKNVSFLAHVGSKATDAETTSRKDAAVQCQYWKIYSERIQFLTSK